MKKWLESLLIPLSAIVVALVLFALFIAIVGTNPVDVFYSLYRGAFGSWFAWQNTLLGSAPLMLTALCTALPARMGLIVIGGEGALIVGGLFAAIIGLLFPEAPSLLGTLLMIIASICAGGLWLGAVAAMKYFRGVNETISSLLMNYIAIAVLNFLIVGPLKDPQTLNKPSTFAVNDSYLIGSIGDSMVHWGFVFGVVICVVVWFLMRRTTYGFAIDVAGGNVRAAQMAGLSVKKLMLSTFFFAGAAGGLAGALEVLAVHGRANSSLNAGYGYEGILIAFLARFNPIAIIPVAILMGGIRAGNGVIQRQNDLPDATGLVLQGILFLVILASEAFYGRIRWLQPKVQTV